MSFAFVGHRGLATLALASFILSSCGGGATSRGTLVVPGGASSTSTGVQSGATQSGSVVLPSSVSQQATGTLRAANSIGTTQVAANGSFSIPTFSTDAQFVSINNAAGQSLLVGWLGSAEPVVNAHTTAEVYVYYAAFVYTLPDPASRAAVMTSIQTLPGLPKIESAVTSALVANPTLSPGADAGVQSAIAALVSALRTSSAMKLRAGSGLTRMSHLFGNRRTSDLSASMTSASGIELILGNGDSLQFKNNLRREAAAFIDEVSHVDSTNATINNPARDVNPPVSIAPVSGIGSVLGAVSDYLSGNYALVPTYTDPIEMPNIAGAKSTVYRVAVVGPGVGMVDFASLTSVEQKKMNEEFVSTIIYEVTLPLVASILVPNAKFGPFNRLTNPAVNALVQDVIATIASDARVKAAAENGDTRGVFTTAVADFVQSTVLTEKLCEAALLLFETQFVQATKVTANLLNVAETVAPAIRVFDGGIALLDAVTIIQDEAAANKGDIFTVTVKAPTTTLQTASGANSASIPTLGVITLTAALHPPSSDPIVYRYATQGLFGKLTDGAGQVNNFTSSYATVTYTAGATGGGTDTITVTPIVRIKGQPDEDLTPATATVSVGATPTPSPTQSPATTITLTLEPSGCIQFGYGSSSKVLTAHVSGAPKPGRQFAYSWYNSQSESGFTLDVPGGMTGAPYGTAGLTPSATLTSPNYSTSPPDGVGGQLVWVHLLEYDGQNFYQVGEPDGTVVPGVYPYIAAGSVQCSAIDPYNK